MKHLKLLALSFLFISACTAIKPSVSNQYKLSDFSQQRLSKTQNNISLLVTQTEAVTGYQTEQMLYVKTPYEVSPFAKSAWISAPADMMFPLVLQSIQSTGYFYAVASSPYSDKTDYRLDTQLIELQQNFLNTPSEIHFVAKAVVTRVSDNHVIASKVFTMHVPCPEESPFGGVVAANYAVKTFTAQLSAFTVNAVKRNKNASSSTD